MSHPPAALVGKSPGRCRSTTRTLLVPLLAFSLLLSLTATGCTSTSDSAITEDVPPPESTHAVMLISEMWASPTVPKNEEDVEQGSSWRIVAIDLTTGEQDILAEEASATTSPLFMPALSPDGTRLLYATQMQIDPSDFVPRMGDLGDALELHVLDLDTGLSSDVCSETVRSFGWDGDDIIATTWRGMWLLGEDENGGVSYTSPPPNAVIRVSDSKVTTIVAEVPTPDDVDHEGAGMIGQLDYLGQSDGDLYFKEVSNTSGLISGSALKVWRVRSGETSPSIALNLQPNMQDWVMNGGPYEELLRRSYTLNASLVPSLLEGVLPTREWYVRLSEDPRGFGYGQETSITVNVRRASTMDVERSFEMTGAAYLEGASPFPVFDNAITRWLDQRLLEPPAAPEKGMYLCETDANSLETTKVAMLSDGTSFGQALGYIGSDLDVLYTTSNDVFGTTDPRVLSIWDRSADERRELAILEGDHENTRFAITFIGGITRE